MKNFGAIDTPSIDYVIPKWDVIESKVDDKNKLEEASSIYDDILLNLSNANLPGSKFTIDQKTADICRDLVFKLEDILAGTDLVIRRAGGTGYRKLFYSKLILKDKIEAKLFGAAGNDKTGRELRSMIAKNNISLVDSSEFLPHTREALLITRKHSKDRIAAKFPYKEAEFFHDEKKLLEHTKGCNHFYLESSLIKFLGKDKFIDLCKKLSENKTKIIYAPPTDRSFFIDKNGLPLNDNIQAFRLAAKYADIITMNELEAIWYIGDVNFNGRISGRDDPNLVKAISSIKKLLQKYDDKLVLVTVGEYGMIGITKDFTTEKDARKVDMIINTVGAGDSSAAAVACVMCEANFIINKNSVEKALNKACDISAYVIQNQPSSNF